MSKVAVLGLGKLGLCLVASLARAGHKVSGFDIFETAVQALRDSTPLVFEPGLRDLLLNFKSSITAFDDVEAALDGTEVAFVIVPTPSEDSGAFSNQYVLRALEIIGAHLRKNKRKFTVVISSTVMPGSCDEVFVPHLERFSEMKVGEGLGLGYSPEFIALGSILDDMTNPDLVLVGASDDQTAEIVAEIARSRVDNSPVVRKMSLSSAEIAKISINTFVTTKISFANMLSEICDHIPGSDIDDVTSALGADRRVGSHYLRAALGYGGPCFPRDNAALSFAAESRGVPAEIARATDSVNNRQVSRVVRLVLDNSTPGDLVAIVGLAYKSSTPVTEKSQAMEIALTLSNTDRKLICFDPLVPLVGGQFSEGLPASVSVSSLSGARVMVIANPELEYGTVPVGCTVIDLWGRISSDDRTVLRPGTLSKGRKPTGDH